MNTPLLLRPEEAAQLLKISRSQTYRLLAAGELPSLRIGRSIRVPLAALTRWVEEGCQEGGGHGPENSGGHPR